MTASTTTPGSQRQSWFSANRPLAIAAVGVLALIAVGVAGYVVGNRHDNVTKVLVGKFHVGQNVASASVDGWAYGVSDSVPWVDSSGNMHEDGWPACLSRAGTEVRVRFGEVSVAGPQSESWRAIVWVDCRGATVTTH
jgi:hypothetical protein